MDKNIFNFDKKTGLYIHPSKPSVDYADGSEEYLLELFRNSKELKSSSFELAKHIKDWPTRYHLSLRRSNLLNAVSELFNKDSAVLELGCGCGILTRWFGENFRSVDGVEGSLVRAQVARERTRDLGNVTLFAGDMLKVQYPENNYGLISLVGVMEYIPYYRWEKGSDHKKPCIEFLGKLSQALADEGTLLIAIENKLGLKYFSGCSEDHTGKYFEGLVGYPNKTPVTFSRVEMEEILTAAGFKNIQFYHPFPDYKLPETVMMETEEVLSLFPYNWIRTPFPEHYRARPYIFSEALALKTMTEAKLLWQFSNSFLVLASKSPGVKLKTDCLIRKFYNNEDQKPVFHHTVSLEKGDKGGYTVKRKPLDSGQMSVGLENIDFRIVETDEFIHGESVLQIICEAFLSNNPLDAVMPVIQKVHEELLSNYSKGDKDEEGYPLVEGNAIDYTFWNLISPKGLDLKHVDKKWRFKREIPIDFVLFRSLYAIHGNFGPFIKEKNTARFIVGILRNIYPDYNKARLKKSEALEELFQNEVGTREFKLNVSDRQVAFNVLDNIQNLGSELQSRERRLQEGAAQLREKEAQLQEGAAQLQERDTQLRTKDAQLQERDTQLRTKDAQLQERATQLQAKDAQLRERAAQLQAKDAQLRERAAQLQAKDAQLREKNAQLAAREQQLLQIGEEIARESRLVEENNIRKDEEIRKQKEELQTRSDELRTAQAELAHSREAWEKEQQAYDRLVREKEQRIADLLSSMSWKITSPLRAVYDILSRQKK